MHPSMVANLSARPGRATPHHPPPARSPFLGLHVLGTEASLGAGPPAGGAAAHWAPFPEEPRSWRPGPADAPPPVPSCGGPSRCGCRAAALRPQPGGPGQCLGAVPKPISESRDPHPSLHSSPIHPASEKRNGLGVRERKGRESVAWEEGHLPVLCLLSGRCFHALKPWPPHSSPLNAANPHRCCFGQQMFLLLLAPEPVSIKNRSCEDWSVLSGGFKKTRPLDKKMSRTTQRML